MAQNSLSVAIAGRHRLVCSRLVGGPLYNIHTFFVIVNYSQASVKPIWNKTGVCVPFAGNMSIDVKKN